MCYWHNFQSSKSDWFDRPPEIRVIGTIFSPRNLIGWMIHEKMCYWHNFQSSKSDWLDDSSKVRVIGTIFSPRNLIGWMIHQKYVLLAQFSLLEIWLGGWFIKNTCYWHNFQSSKSDWFDRPPEIRVIGTIFSPRNLIGWMIHQKYVLLAQFLALEIWLAGWFIKSTCYWHNFRSSKSDWVDGSSKIRVIDTIFSPRNLIGWMIHQKYVLLAQFSLLEIWLGGWFIKNTCYWHNFHSSKSDWVDASLREALIGRGFGLWATTSLAPLVWLNYRS